ncbi:MAG: SRPBCC family protein [Verrucomicrobiae bacterium]|nr:SRPBCC family protein [Verrucomicrobiae bacterium]
MRCLFTGLMVLVAILVAGVALIYLLTDADTRVERSIVIAAPAEAIFPKLNSLKESETWSPWKEEDPKMEITYEGPESGVGALSRWESATQGTGSQTILESVPPSKLVTALDFGSMGTATADFTLSPEAEGGTKVTWGMVSHGGNNLGFRAFNLALDKLVGPMFEKGLSNLKATVEAPE